MAKKKAKKAPAKAAKAAKKPAKAPAKKAAKKAPAKKTRPKKVQPVPPGYRTVTPYLTLKGVKEMIEFLKNALGAKVKFQMTTPDGSVMHAELKIGDSMVMVGECPAEQPPTYTSMYLYVKDCDKAYAQAIKAGGVSIMEPTNQFYGDRSGAIRDPRGNQWWFGTHVEDLSPKEIARRAQQAHRPRD